MVIEEIWKKCWNHRCWRDEDLSHKAKTKRVLRRKKNSPRRENENKRQTTNNGKSQVVKSKIPVVYDVDVDIETESYRRDDESEEGELESLNKISQ